MVNPVSSSALVAGAAGVTLRVRLRPGGSRNAVLGRVVLANGDQAVLAAVTAPPEGGKANAALIQLLAKTWRLPKRDVILVAGGAARTKKLHVAGPPAALMARLGSWIDALPTA